MSIKDELIETHTAMLAIERKRLDEINEQLQLLLGAKEESVQSISKLEQKLDLLTRQSDLDEPH